MRNGSQYLSGLRDNRSLYANGERITDVTSHESFRGICRTFASLYDISFDPAEDLQHSDPDSGITHNRAYIVPRSREDLRARRLAITRWAEATHGLAGRSPDHVGGFLAGFAGGKSFFGDRADNVAAAYRKVIQEDLFVSYVIIPPQIDRSKTASERDAYSQVGVVRETDGGIVVRGGQMLGTSTAVSDLLFVSCIVPLKPGDEDYALSFIIPVTADGLRLICRPPYAQGRTSRFDYPLSTQFDETDVLAVFDDVFVPWESIFIYRNIAKTRAQFFETPAHVLGNTQAQIRLSVKLKFLSGIARKLTAVTATDTIPAVREKLGELASLASGVEGMVLAAEATSSIDDYGVARPNPKFLYGAMGLQSETYPRAVQILRELAGGGVLQVPASHLDMRNPEIADDIRQYIRGGATESEERIKLFKLAWDLVGTEFAGRHTQYEMFYAGAPHVARTYSFMNYGYDDAVARVDRFLDTYDIDSPL